MFLSSLLLVLVQFLFITSSYQFLQSIKFATRSVKNFQKKSFHFQENTKSNFYTSSYIRLELAVMYKQKSTEAYSELCQTSKIDCFPIFPKSSILHVLTCSEYVSSPVDCRHCYKQLYTLRKRQICCQSANFAEILQRNIFMHKYLHIFMQLEVFYKKGALEISQNSRENTSVRVSFLIKLQASGLFYRTAPGQCFFSQCPYLCMSSM